MIKIVQVHQNIKSNSSPYKIKKALEKRGIIPQIITMGSSVNDANIVVLKSDLIYKFKTKIFDIRKKIEYKLNYNLLQGYPFSYFEIGIRVDRLKLIKDSDVIMLHWICGGFISPKVIKKLCLLNKKIIWVCHDSWPFTGGCHVKMGCDLFKEGCGDCPMLQSKIKKDWSYRLLRKKKKSIDKSLFTIVSPSKWMDRNVEESFLFKGCNHLVIPNPIDIKKYTKKNKNEIREKYNIQKNKIIILFGAVNATSTPYKGYYHLINALNIFFKMINNQNRYEIVVFGAYSGNDDNTIPFKIHYLGKLSEEQMIEAYSLSDIFVMPTLDDNLPNTVMESLACELPVVSFDTGGVSDMLLHKKSGYLARYKDDLDLAHGIKWVLDNNQDNNLGRHGRQYICDNFNENVVGEKYETLIYNVIDSKCK